MLKIKVGNVAVLKEGNRFIYYLAIKDKVNERFNHANFVSCLENVRDHMVSVVFAVLTLRHNI